MKKIWLVLLSLCMLLCLSACGKCETHRFLSSKYRVEKEATCTSEGLAIKVCGECGYEEEYKLPKTEHNYVKTSTTQTCTESGNATY